MDFYFKKLNQLFNRVGKRKKQITNTHFHYPLKPTHLKGRKVPLQLLPAKIRWRSLVHKIRP